MEAERLAPSDLRTTFASLEKVPLRSDEAFQRIVTGGRLRHAGPDGAPDLIDDLSAALVCSGLHARPPLPVLVVLPDDAPRRSPLLFATALTMAAVAQMREPPTQRRVLYFASYPGIRSQLSSVRLGKLDLHTVFDQSYARGESKEVRAISTSGGLHLPSVLCVFAPADPRALLQQHRPHWVAVDCGDKQDLQWLPDLLRAAAELRLPVLGWSREHLGRVEELWVSGGGGVLRWPRLAPPESRITAPDMLARSVIAAEVTPNVISGDAVTLGGRAFVRATESILAARAVRGIRLCADASAVSWRYLRALEGLVAPLDVFDREARSHWGSRSLADLRGDLESFVRAIERSVPTALAHFGVIEEALGEVHDQFTRDDSPLWHALVTMCVEATSPTDVVFTSRTALNAFSRGVLAKYNIGETDWASIKVRLSSLRDREALEPDDESEGPSRRVILVGLPSVHAERRMVSLFRAGRLEVLVWPHQEPLLRYRLLNLSRRLGFTSVNLGKFVGGMASGGTPVVGEDDRSDLRVIRVAASNRLSSGTGLREPPTKAGTSLWTRPDVAGAIADLMQVEEKADEETTASTGPEIDEASETEVGVENTTWVSDAVELRVEGSRCVLFPSDETVNLVLRSGREVRVELRYVRSLRSGDEILFIQGQRRQSLYDLLVSRVHRDPVIAQYLALVGRWQDEFARAFAEAERRGMDADRLLDEIRRRGSVLTSPQTIRTWVRRMVLAPNDMQDLKRVAEVLALPFVGIYYKQVHQAARRLKGLHINLSTRLNRWLASDSASAAVGSDEDVIDADLGLTVADFKHSLLRLTVLQVLPVPGPFYRPRMGRLEMCHHG